MLFPVILFFIAYKLADIFVATAVAIAASFAQVLFHWIRQRSIKGTQLTQLILITLLGGATLLLHNEMFIKWKLTAVYWVFAIAFLASHWSKTLLIERLIDLTIDLPRTVWKRINLSWTVFFASLGAFNLYIAYHFNTNTWVNFKLFGTVTLTLLFAIAQGLYLLTATRLQPPSPPNHDELA